MRVGLNSVAGSDAVFQYAALPATCCCCAQCCSMHLPFTQAQLPLYYKCAPTYAVLTHVYSLTCVGGQNDICVQASSAD